MIWKQLLTLIDFYFPLQEVHAKIYITFHIKVALKNALHVRDALHLTSNIVPQT